MLCLKVCSAEVLLMDVMVEYELKFKTRRKRRQLNIRNERDRTKRSVATEEEKQKMMENTKEHTPVL